MGSGAFGLRVGFRLWGAWALQFGFRGYIAVPRSKGGLISYSRRAEADGLFFFFLRDLSGVPIACGSEGLRGLLNLQNRKPEQSEVCPV